MTTFRSAAEFVAEQRRLLLDLETVRAPFERTVRSLLAVQERRIFQEGRKSSGQRIGSYDTTRELYVNPRQVVRSTAFTGPGVRLEGLRPPRGKPSPLWKNPIPDYPDGEQVFTGATAWRGGKGTKAGDPHKTTWVRNYKDLRNRIGRRVDTVDLIFTGDLRADWSTAALRGRAVRDATGLELRVTLKRARNAQKREGLEERFGSIFETTLTERKLFFKLLRAELRAARSKPK